MKQYLEQIKKAEKHNSDLYKGGGAVWQGKSDDAMVTLAKSLGRDLEPLEGNDF
jgi:hypothetical protein